MNDEEEKARERIADAREEAAAYVVQRQPLDPGSDVGEAEERVVDAVEEARSETDPEALSDLAEEAEEGRDELRRELYGRGSER
jgi:ribosome maturation protein Sdo1